MNDIEETKSNNVSTYCDFNTIICENVHVENEHLLPNFHTYTEESSTDTISSNDSIVTLYSFIDTDEDMRFE